VEIPLLFQSHSDIFCDEVIAVDAPEESRLRWLLHRNGERAHLLWLLAETNDWYTYKDHIDHVLFNDQTYAEWSLTCQQVIMDYKLAAEGK
jgi:dephospho-CoA kinase